MMRVRVSTILRFLVSDHAIVAPSAAAKRVPRMASDLTDKKCGVVT